MLFHSACEEKKKEISCFVDLKEKYLSWKFMKCLVFFSKHELGYVPNLI